MCVYVVVQNVSKIVSNEYQSVCVFVFIHAQQLQGGGHWRGAAALIRYSTKVRTTNDLS